MWKLVIQTALGRRNDSLECFDGSRALFPPEAIGMPQKLLVCSHTQYRHGQSGQSGAMSQCAGWVVRHHIAMFRMGNPVAYRYEQNG